MPRMPRFIGIRETAQMMGISYLTLYNAIRNKSKNIPPYIYTGANRVKFDRLAVEKYMNTPVNR